MQDEGDTQASKRTGIVAVAHAEIAAEELV
jgi:hypothetical protein